MKFLLVHGWGFGADFWEPLKAELGDHDTVAPNLGFCGETRVSAFDEEPMIAVGHSLGCLWLLHERPCPFEALIAINGFAKFDEPPRVLERMRRDPVASARQFRARCGVTEEGDFNAERLDEGLQWLRDWDEREALAALDVPFLALGGLSDPIAPTEKSSLPRQALRLHDGEHTLPLTAPAWCAGEILGLLMGLQ